MSIFSYLDIRLATKKLLRGWHDRIFKIEHNNERIEEIRTRLTKSTQNMSASPVRGGGSKAEDNLINGLDRIDRLIAELNEADDVQQELEHCWVRLTPEERQILREMFIDNEDRQGISRVKDFLCVEKSEAYKRVNDALDRLSHLLYW